MIIPPLSAGDSTNNTSRIGYARNERSIQSQGPHDINGKTIVPAEKAWDATTVKQIERDLLIKPELTGDELQNADIKI